MSTSRGRTRRRPNLRPTPPPTTAAAVAAASSSVDPSSCSTRSSREPRRRGGRCATTRRCSSASQTDTSTSTPRSSVTCRFPSPTPRGGCKSTPRWVTPPIGRPRVIVHAGFGWTTASLSSAFSLRPVRGPRIRRRWTRSSPRRRRCERSWTNSRGRRRRRTWCRGWTTSSSFGLRGNAFATHAIWQIQIQIQIHRAAGRRTRRLSSTSWTRSGRGCARGASAGTCSASTGRRRPDATATAAAARRRRLDSSAKCFRRGSCGRSGRTWPRTRPG
mmetsp:Transcript_13735/g.59941  ORF Transcript_13735/g.59941 Transcript_13735/m.59941 type:complete len:274 (+) Transcript_13735:459-1280(+)